MNVEITHWTNWYWDHTGLAFHKWQPKLVIDSSIYKFDNMVVWLYKHIDDPIHNVLWIHDNDRHKSVFRFRESKDQVFFVLRWS